MTVLGIILGLVTAWGHSLGYLASRWFTVGGRGTSGQLLIVAHLQLGILSFVAMPFAWPEGLEGSWSWLAPALSASVVLKISQASLFAALRYADASVVSPLLSGKIAVLALVTTLGLYGDASPVSVLGWLGVALAIAGAVLMQGVGKRPHGAALVWVLVALMGYAFCDLSIVRAIRAVTSEPGVAARLHAGLFVATLVYGGTGVIALLLCPWYGSRRPKVWRDALPYAAAWSVAMVSLYGCFALLGAVHGAILQSTRALWSVLIGGVVGKMGKGEIETNHHPTVLGWRLAAAAMMVAAVALYAYASVGL